MRTRLSNKDIKKTPMTKIVLIEIRKKYLCTVMMDNDRVENI